jgi:predicted ATP-grasp superfamily ATP-dependent carboligase
MGTAILIAAPSGRALAAAARRAGYRPLVADFFGDSDTRGFCAANRLIEGGLNTGFEGEGLISALEALAKGEAPCGLVYGAGFEDRAELLEAVGRRWTLFGNPPAVVRSVKDPVRLAELCAALNIPHPKISARLPTEAMSRRRGRFARKASKFTSSASPRASLFRSCFLAMEPRRGSSD